MAASLRMLDASEWSCYGQEFDAIMDACGCNFGQDQQDVELKDRLADLIEPEPERTCTFSEYQTGDEHFPTCSSCGYEAAREECEDYVGVVYYEKRYCPNCGAKVVQE